MILVYIIRYMIVKLDKLSPKNVMQGLLLNQKSRIRALRIKKFLIGSASPQIGPYAT